MMSLALILDVSSLEECVLQFWEYRMVLTPRQQSRQAARFSRQQLSCLSGGCGE